MPSTSPSLVPVLFCSLAFASCAANELRDYALPDQFHAYYTSSDGEVDNSAPALDFDHDVHSLAFGLTWDLAPRRAPERGITRDDLAALLQELRTPIPQEAAASPLASAPEPEPPPDPPLAETLLAVAEPLEPTIEEPPPEEPEEAAPPPVEEPSPSETAEVPIEPPPEEPPAAEAAPVEAAPEEPLPPPVLQPAVFPVIPASTTAAGGWSTQGPLLLGAFGVAVLAAGLWISGSLRRKTG